jgi:hypothetical protein
VYPVPYVDQLFFYIDCHSGCPLTSGRSINVTPASTVTHIDFELTMGGGISGTVTNAATGAIVVGFPVALYNATGLFVKNTNTNHMGVYTFSGLLGRYYVRTSSSGSFVDQLYNGVLCIACDVTTSGGMLVLAQGPAIPGGIDFHLLPTQTPDSDLDGDGIDDTIDRGLDGSSQTTTPSNIFNDGSTSGTITRRVGDQTVSVSDFSDVAGVQVDIDPRGSCPFGSRCAFDATNSVQIVVCGIDKRVTFHDAVVGLTCSGSTATVTAIQAPLAKGGVLFERLFRVLGLQQFRVVARLTTGQTLSTGSPFTAAPSNTESITVDVLDETGTTIGTFALDPGEAVDISVDEQPGGLVTVSATLLQGDVAITIYGQPHTLTEGETNTFTVDSIPPTTTASGSLGTAGGPSYVFGTWANQSVFVNLSASDNSGGSGVAQLTYGIADEDAIPTAPEPASIATFSIGAEGETTITYQATDVAGNVESPRAIAVRIDRTAPVVTAPGPMTANATSPGGAVVTFSVSATDNSGAASVTCSHASGSTFPPGVTTVTCTAADLAGNDASTTFTVTVRGVAEQIVDLIEQLRRMPLQPAVEARLIATLNDALADPRRSTRLCRVLNAFSVLVQLYRGRGIPAEVAATLAADAKRIRAVIGCS